jgi:type I restriction enzyme M protein
LLIRAARNGNAEDIFGQEKNPTTYNLCRMNMLLHGIKFNNFSIENNDTLEKDEFADQQFDAVVANPPFSASWSADSKFLSDDRFSKAGVLAPKSKADYAFILHMVYHLNEGGTMACVAPHGVLFRGSAEGTIRRFLIETKNYIDAIIGLPANIFYGTSIPTCILVLKKCRKESDNILFIDASKEFEKVKTQNKLREEHIKKIVETYRERKEIEKYSHLATLDEVKENDFNLNIPRYVDTFEEEEEIDIKAVMQEIKDLEAKRADLDKEIEVYLRELGIVE